MKTWTSSLENCGEHFFFFVPFQPKQPRSWRPRRSTSFCNSSLILSLVFLKKCSVFLRFIIHILRSIPDTAALRSDCEALFVRRPHGFKPHAEPFRRGAFCLHGFVDLVVFLWLFLSWFSWVVAGSLMWYTIGSLRRAFYFEKRPNSLCHSCVWLPVRLSLLCAAWRTTTRLVESRASSRMAAISFGAGTRRRRAWWDFGVRNWNPCDFNKVKQRRHLKLWNLVSSLSVKLTDTLLESFFSNFLLLIYS